MLKIIGQRLFLPIICLKIRLRDEITLSHRSYRLLSMDWNIININAAM